MGVAHAGAFAEEGVGLVEEQNPVLVFGFVEKTGQVFFRFADEFGDDHRQVDAIHIAAGVFAQEGCREGFSGAGRAVKKGAEARFEAFAHAEFVEQARAVAEPAFEFVYLAENRGRQHQVVPFHEGFEAVGREVHAKTRSADAAQRKQLGVFRVEDQSAGAGGFAGAQFFEVQDSFFCKKVFCIKELHDLSTAVFVFAGEQEQHGFAGGQEAAVVGAFDAAEGREVAALGQEFGDDVVEKGGAQVWGEGGGEQGEFVHRQSLLQHELAERRAVVGHGGRGGRRGGFTEVGGDAVAGEGVEVGEGHGCDLLQKTTVCKKQTG